MPRASLPADLIDHLAPWVLTHDFTRIGQAQEALSAVGCSHDAEQLAEWLLNYHRSEMVPAGCWMSGRKLADLLRQLPGEWVTPSDWPVDMIDTDTRRYRLSYLMTRRHVLTLVCHHLAGATVAGDVYMDLALARIGSRQRTLSMQSYWGQLLSRGHYVPCG